jgi:ATP phosphoribosyltransferase regulatory subunit
MSDQKWRMPAGVDEWLPPAAWRLEQVRRRVLDVFHAWGFQYIEPPIVDYLDALLVGGGDDLDLQTLKVVDQRSGRLLGVRADLTAQAVRVDAHSMPTDGVLRLCYAGNLVYANPVSSVDNRVPLKAGAEIFGSPSLAADAEVVALMVEVLAAVEIAAPVVVLGHMGIYHALTAQLTLTADQQEALFAAVQSKSETDIRALAPAGPLGDALVRLPTLMGGVNVLTEAEACLRPLGGDAIEALEQLQALADQVSARCPDIAVRFDLAELAGYGYHNGPVFSAYHGDHGQALARGGRYDGIGADFGRSRPATGFDVSLKALVSDPQPVSGIWVPFQEAATEASERAALNTAIRDLRRKGEAVVVAISAAEQPPEFCDRQPIRDADGWLTQGRTK